MHSFPTHLFDNVLRVLCMKKVCISNSVTINKLVRVTDLRQFIVKGWVYSSVLSGTHGADLTKTPTLTNVAIEEKDLYIYRLCLRRVSQM